MKALPLLLCFMTCELSTSEVPTVVPARPPRVLGTVATACGPVGSVWEGGAHCMADGGFEVYGAEGP